MFYVLLNRYSLLLMHSAGMHGTWLPRYAFLSFHYWLRILMLSFRCVSWSHVQFSYSLMHLECDAVWIIWQRLYAEWFISWVHYFIFVCGFLVHQFVSYWLDFDCHILLCTSQVHFSLSSWLLLRYGLTMGLNTRNHQSSYPLFFRSGASIVTY